MNNYRRRIRGGFRLGASLLILLVLGEIGSASTIKNKNPAKEKPVGKVLSGEEAYRKIINTYTFVGDLEPKEELRKVAPIYFWKYPFKAPKAKFPIDHTLGTETDLPATQGDDRPIEHLNYGRILFKAGRIEEAKTTWLAARARYGTDYKYHRRTDYFIALAFLKTAENLKKSAKTEQDKVELRLSYANAATFLSWVFVKKKDLYDPVLDGVTPKALMVLASIYYSYGRYPAAHAVVQEGLDFLRAKGRSDFRPRFLRMLAEAWILNNDYLSAIQELDTAIRQDPSPDEAARAFSRVGDIYFDLNNYELAEDVYGISEKVNAYTTKKFKPQSAVLRGESLFWMGKFAEARKFLEFGVGLFSKQRGWTTSYTQYAPWALLRIGDAFLAEYALAKASGKLGPDALAKLHQNATVAYFGVEHQFPYHEAAHVAMLRRTCLELPGYETKNVDHARDYLSKTRQGAIPKDSQELAWSCEVGSYAQRDLSPSMVDRVKDFVEVFPGSQYIQQFVEPVKDSRRRFLDEYIKNAQHYKAVQFYELYRDSLFKHLTFTQKAGMFVAYLDTYQTQKASAFWPEFHQLALDPWRGLQSAAFTAEMASKGGGKAWDKINREQAKVGNEREWVFKNTPNAMAYIHRIVESNAGFLHLPWLLKLALHWAETDSKLTCSLVYSLLSQSNEMGSKEQRAAVRSQITKIVSSEMPKLYQTNPGCAENYLDLELAAFDEDKAAYASAWLQRLEWPSNEAMFRLIWTASEILQAHHDLESASRLWTYLSEKAPAASTEAVLAKLRLDPVKTEHGQLWNDSF